MHSYLNGDSSLNGVIIAPLWRRGIAGGIDALLVLAAEMFLSLIGVAIYSFAQLIATGSTETTYNLADGGESGGWIMIAATFSIFVIYHTLLLRYWNGHTIGKNFLKVRVLSKNGGDPSLIEALIRSLLMPLSILPVLVGYLLFFRSRKNSSFHDWIAGTIVLSEEIEHYVVRDPAHATAPATAASL